MELRPPVRGIFFDLGWTLLYPPSGDWMFSGFARKYFPRDKLSALPPVSYTHLVLPPFTQNKSIQKIRESFRVGKADKEMLLQYKL